MKHEMNHDEAFAALDAAALDALDAPERDALLAHVDTCAICRAELSSLRETLGQLALVPPEVDATTCRREPIRQRLIARVSASASASGSASRSASASALSVRALAGRSPMQWLALAATLLFVASTALFLSAVHDRQQLREALAAQAAADAHRQDSLRVALQARDSMLAGLADRSVAMMELTASGAHPPFARMFWDKARDTWTLVAHDMPALRAGRTYQLWLMTPSAKISAGTFEPRNGEAVVHATYALAADSLRAIAVTEEPAGGMPQPTGAIVIAGTGAATPR